MKALTICGNRWLSDKIRCEMQWTIVPLCYRTRPAWVRILLRRRPVTGPVWPREFQEISVPCFSWHSVHEGDEVVNITHRPRLPPRKFLVLIFTRGWVDPTAMVRSEGNMSLKNPVTQPAIDPGTVRLVAQRLNHYATTGTILLRSWYINVT